MTGCFEGVERRADLFCPARAREFVGKLAGNVLQLFTCRTYLTLNGPKDRQAKMELFYVVVEDAAGVPFSAAVVAEDEAAALDLLQADPQFSGYRMPPVELSPLELKGPARHLIPDPLEKGVFALGRLNDPSDKPGKE